MLEDDGRYGDKEDASGQDEEQRGGHSDLGLADLVMLPLQRELGQGERDEARGMGVGRMV